MQPLEVAQAYRAEHQTPPGGVVLVWRGTAYGWKNELRDPGHERPGALAVGGDDYHGAKSWSVVS